MGVRQTSYYDDIEASDRRASYLAHDAAAPSHFLRRWPH